MQLALNLRFVFIFPCAGLNSAHAPLNAGLVFARLAFISMVVSVVLHMFAIGLFLRFLCPIFDPTAFVPNTFCKHMFSILSISSICSLIHNPGEHTYFGSNLYKPLLEQKYTKVMLLRRNRLLHENHAIHCRLRLAG